MDTKTYTQSQKSVVVTQAWIIQYVPLSLLSRQLMCRAATILYKHLTGWGEMERHERRDVVKRNRRVKRDRDSERPDQQHYHWKGRCHPATLTIHKSHVYMKHQMVTDFKQGRNSESTLKCIWRNRFKEKAVSVEHWKIRGSVSWIHWKQF